MKTKCTQCGIEIDKRPCDIKKYKNSFCSLKCYWGWMKGKTYGEILGNENAGKKKRELLKKNIKAIRSTDESRLKTKKATLEMWENNRDKMVDVYRKSWENNEERRKIASEKMKERWADGFRVIIKPEKEEERRRKISLNSKGINFFNHPNISEEKKIIMKQKLSKEWFKGKRISGEYMKQHSLIMKKLYAEGKIKSWNKGKPMPEETKKKLRKPHPTTAGENNPSKRPEVRKKIGNFHRGKIRSDEAKLKMSETAKRLYVEGKIIPYWKGKQLTKEMRYKMSIAKKGKYLGADNHFYGKKHSKETIEKMFKSLKRRPTSYEKELGEILNKIQPNEWKYTGDGSFLIGYKNPDFVNINGKKIAIEVYAKIHKQWGYGSEENYKKQRSEHFAKYGYETIFLNGDDLNIDTVGKRLKDA